MNDYLDETEKYVLPMAHEVNSNMAIELRDLVKRRRKLVKIMEDCGPKK